MRQQVKSFELKIFEEYFAELQFLETWALPITVVVAIVAYAVLATVFYNMDA